MDFPCWAAFSITASLLPLTVGKLMAVQPGCLTRAKDLPRGSRGSAFPKIAGPPFASKDFLIGAG